MDEVPRERGEARAAVTGGAVFLWARKRGSNEVVGSSPAEAAHGVAAGAPSLSHSVTDAELEAMTTIEFAPPRGLEPWQGAVVLTEKLDDSSVTAWFSGAIASDVLGIEVQRGKPRLSQGPAAARGRPAFRCYPALPLSSIRLNHTHSAAAQFRGYAPGTSSPAGHHS